MCCTVQVPLHLTICDTFTNWTLCFLFWQWTSQCQEAAVWTFLYVQCTYCIQQGLFCVPLEVLLLFLCFQITLKIQARYKEYLIMFTILSEHLSKNKPFITSYVNTWSPSNSQQRSPCQMLMNDRQRSKLVMDTFIDRAADLPDYDVCFLATGSHQISGGCQLKSARIISQTGSLLYHRQL